MGVQANSSIPITDWMTAFGTLGAVIITLLVLAIGWIRSQFAFKIEIIESGCSFVSATNFSGTTLSVDLRIYNKGGVATSVYKVDATIRLDEKDAVEVFDLTSDGGSFPYVGRGILILGHDVNVIPVTFSFSGARFQEKQKVVLRVWHTLGKESITFDANSTQGT